MNTPKPFVIKPLTPGDLDAVIDIDMSTTGISRRGYFQKRLAAATDHPKNYVYVGIHVDDQLQGFAFARLVDGDFGTPGASASLDAIGTRPEHSHRGYGQILLNEVETVLHHKGVDSLTSQVDWENAGVLGFLSGAGFQMSPRLVLTRTTAKIPPVLEQAPEDDDNPELDYSSPESDDFAALSQDRIPVRSMVEGDLRKVITIDSANSGFDRSGYCSRKMHESLHESGVRVSLVAEREGFNAGFIMARVDFGEFGHTSPEAVLDTIGVDPGYASQGVGTALMSQLMANLAILRVENVRTEISWNDVDLIAYFNAMGFVPAQRITLSRAL